MNNIWRDSGDSATPSAGLSPFIGWDQLLTISSNRELIDRELHSQPDLSEDSESRQGSTPQFLVQQSLFTYPFSANASSISSLTEFELPLQLHSTDIEDDEFLIPKRTNVLPPQEPLAREIAELKQLQLLQSHAPRPPQPVAAIQNNYQAASDESSKPKLEITCMACGQRQDGKQYLACKECPMFHLCMTCSMNGFHPHHEMIRVMGTSIPSLLPSTVLPRHQPEAVQSPAFAPSMIRSYSQPGVAAAYSRSSNIFEPTRALPTPIGQAPLATAPAPPSPILPNTATAQGSWTGGSSPSAFDSAPTIWNFNSSASVSLSISPSDDVMTGERTLPFTEEDFPEFESSKNGKIAPNKSDSDLSVHFSSVSRSDPLTQKTQPVTYATIINESKKNQPPMKIPLPPPYTTDAMAVPAKVMTHQELEKFLNDTEPLRALPPPYSSTPVVRPIKPTTVPTQAAPAPPPPEERKPIIPPPAPQRAAPTWVTERSGASVVAKEPPPKKPAAAPTPVKKPEVLPIIAPVAPRVTPSKPAPSKASIAPTSEKKSVTKKEATSKSAPKSTPFVVTLTGVCTKITNGKVPKPVVKTLVVDVPDDWESHFDQLDTEDVKPEVAPTSAPVITPIVTSISTPTPTSMVVTVDLDQSVAKSAPLSEAKNAKKPEMKDSKKVKDQPEKDAVAKNAPSPVQSNQSHKDKELTAKQKKELKKEEKNKQKEEAKKEAFLKNKDKSKKTSLDISPSEALEIEKAVEETIKKPNAGVKDVEKIVKDVLKIDEKGNKIEEKKQNSAPPIDNTKDDKAPAPEKLSPKEEAPTPTAATPAPSAPTGTEPHTTNAYGEEVVNFDRKKWDNERARLARLQKERHDLQEKQWILQREKLAMKDELCKSSEELSNMISDVVLNAAHRYNATQMQQAAKICQNIIDSMQKDVAEIEMNRLPQVQEAVKRVGARYRKIIQQAVEHIQTENVDATLGLLKSTMHEEDSSRVITEFLQKSEELCSKLGGTSQDKDTFLQKYQRLLILKAELEETAKVEEYRAKVVQQEIDQKAEMYALSQQLRKQNNFTKKCKAVVEYEIAEKNGQYLAIAHPHSGIGAKVEDEANPKARLAKHEKNIAKIKKLLKETGEDIKTLSESVDNLTRIDGARNLLNEQKRKLLEGDKEQTPKVVVEVKDPIADDAAKNGKKNKKKKKELAPGFASVDLIEAFRTQYFLFSDCKTEAEVDEVLETITQATLNEEPPVFKTMPFDPFHTAYMTLIPYFVERLERKYHPSSFKNGIRVKAVKLLVEKVPPVYMNKDEVVWSQYLPERKRELEIIRAKAEFRRNQLKTGQINTFVDPYGFALSQFHGKLQHAARQPEQRAPPAPTAPPAATQVKKTVSVIKSCPICHKLIRGNKACRHMKNK